MSNHIPVSPVPVGAGPPHLAYLVMNKDTGYLFTDVGTGPAIRSIVSINNSAPDKGLITYTDSTTDEITLPLNPANIGEPGRSIHNIAGDPTNPNQAIVTYSDHATDVIQLPPGIPGLDSTVVGPPSTVAGPEGRYIKTISRTGPATARVELSDGGTQDLTLPAGADSSQPGPPGPDSTQPGPPGRDVSSVAMISANVARQTFSDSTVLDVTIPAGAPGPDSNTPGPQGPASTQPGPPGPAGRGLQSVQFSGNSLVTTYTDGTSSSVPLTPDDIHWKPAFTCGIWQTPQSGQTPATIIMKPLLNKSFVYTQNKSITLNANSVYKIIHVMNKLTSTAQVMPYINNAPVTGNYYIKPSYSHQMTQSYFIHKTGGADEQLEFKMVAYSLTTPVIAYTLPATLTIPSPSYEVFELFE